MFVDGELYHQLKKELSNDLVELIDNGKKIIVNGQHVVVDHIGEAIEMFHKLGEESKKDILAKVKKEALKFCKEVLVAADVVVDKVEEKVVEVAKEIVEAVEQVEEKADEVIEKVGEEIQEVEAPVATSKKK